MKEGAVYRWQGHFDAPGAGASDAAAPR